MHNYNAAVATLKNLDKVTIGRLVARAYARVESQVIKLLAIFASIARRVKAILKHVKAEQKRIEARDIALRSSNAGDYVDTPTRREVAATKARNAGPQIASPFTPQLQAMKAARAMGL